MTSFEENPFTWDKSAKGIQSEVVEFTLKNGGTSLNISGLQEPIELFIPVIRTDPKGQNRSHEEYFVKPSDGYRNLQYHRIDIPSANLRVSFKIRPEKGKFLEIFVAAHRKPTSTDFQFNTRLPNYSSCSAFSKPIGYYNCSRHVAVRAKCILLRVCTSWIDPVHAVTLTFTFEQYVETGLSRW